MALLPSSGVEAWAPVPWQRMRRSSPSSRSSKDAPVWAAAWSQQDWAAWADRPAMTHYASGGSTLMRKPPWSSFTRGVAVSSSQVLVNTGL